jgi:general secretion pathway protein K
MVDQYEPLEDLDYMVLINSLKDWIDDNDDDAISGLSGAESAYYMDLDPAYECRNAPLVHIGDLARVKGFPPELFSGNDDMPDASDYLTVYGETPVAGGKYAFDGKININTADTVVLAAILPEGYEIYAQEIYDYRLEAVDESYVNNLSSSTWYRNVPGLEDLEIDEGLITTSSDIFRISATATLDDGVLTTTAVVKREPVEKTGKWHCKVLYWENN